MHPSLSQNYQSRQLDPRSALPPPSAPPLSYGQPQPPPPQCATGIPVHFVAPHHPVNVNWSSSLCGCWSDVPNCCLTCWCPCITFGQIAEIIDKGNTPCGVHGALYTLIQALTGCGCLYSCNYRTKMRSQYGLRESPCNDCLVHFCCEPCALCQEYRTLKHYGYDLSLGWEGNRMRQNYGVQISPMTPQEMFR